MSCLDAVVASINVLCPIENQYMGPCIATHFDMWVPVFSER